MIVFFSNNRASRTYFAAISSALSSNGTEAKVLVDSSIRLPHIKSLLIKTAEFSKAIEQGFKILNAEAISLTGKNLSVFKKIWLKSKARWDFACDVKALKANHASGVVVWNGLMFRRSFFVAAAEMLGVQPVFMENGLLPNTTVCDPRGINAVNSVPRSAEFFRERTLTGKQLSTELVAREAKVEKKSQGGTLPEKFIFVPFQVDTDSQILLFSKWIQNMRQLFDVICKQIEEAGQYKVVFKEHPSSPIDYAYLHDQLSGEVGVFANHIATQELIEKSEAVITINSTVGIESILLGKKVIVLGDCFFNIDDLVLSASDEASLLSAIKQLPSYEVDQSLRTSFLDYLQEDYLIKGSWKEADKEHCNEVAARLKVIFDERN